MRIRLILLFTLIVVGISNAQNDAYSLKQDYFTKFESLTDKDGLSGNNVIDIIQDTIGFMWFATDNGLCRYDGFGFVTYKNILGDSSSISNNIITCLEIDQMGNLWIGTENGLNLFNRNNESFISFYKSVKNQYSLNDNFIKALYADEENNLWIETAGGVLHKLIIGSGEIQKYRHKKPHQPYYRYHSIYEDPDHKLWIGGRGMPITIFDREAEIFSYNEADPLYSDKKRDDDVACYFEDSDHNFYVSATDGVYIMNKEKFSFKKIFRSSTFSIIEDHNGFVWMGSAIGLLKKEKGLDSFINYRKNQDNPFSLVDNHINKLYEDRSGVLWIGTANGISKYSPQKYKFKNYRHIGNISNTISGNKITSIIEDKSGQIWIATQSNGLNRLDPQTGVFSHFKSSGDLKKGLSSDRLSSLYLDRQNNIWVGLWAGVGFNKLNPENNAFTHFAYDPNSYKRDWYNDFIELKDGRFFCGIWGAFGFAEFDRDLEKFTPMNLLNGSRPQNRAVTAIHFNKGKIYMGSNSSKIYEYNVYNQHFKSYFRRLQKSNIKEFKLPFGDQKNIIDVKFRFINDFFSYKDKLLFCASDKGLLIQNLQTQSFSSITTKNASQLLDDNLISFYKLSEDTLCILNAKGLNFFDFKKEQLLSFSIPLLETPISVLRSGKHLFLIYTEFIQKLSIKSKEIVDEYYLNDLYKDVKFSCALEFTNNKIILGTNRGACVFNIEKGIIIEFFDKSFSNTQNWFSVNALFRDHNETVWLGTDIGFGKMNLNNSTIQWVRDSLGEVDRLIKGNVSCFTEDQEGNLWLGTEFGVCIYDINSNKLIDLKTKGKYGLSSHLVNKLFEDKDGNVWIGTSDQGLNVLLKNGELKNYPGDIFDPSGYRSKDVISIYQDSKGSVWVGGNKGLNKFESPTMQVKNFTSEEGLAHNSIMAILEDDSNHLWISTGNGLSKFNLITEKVVRNFNKLDGIQDNSFSRANCKLENGILMFGGDQGISIIDPQNLDVNKRLPEIAFTALYKQNELVTNEISSGDTIILLPATKFFAIEFASLDFTEPLKNNYRYKLSGSFEDWIDLGNEHKISFTNIASGKYRLFISASNNEGIWNEEGIYLVLIIRPPFWRTWWFISSIILTVLIIIFSMLAMKISSLEKEKKNWQLEQRLLRTQMNPHFIFNVLAALQGLIYQKETKIVISYLSKFAALMRSILYHSREENILLDDEILFIENYLKLQQLRFSERFNYKIKVDIAINTSIISIPPMLLQPLIENSIEHGLKEKSKSNGMILISFDKIDDELVIIIEDNGIGIEHVKKLKEIKGKKHKSLGIATTLERIHKINKGNSRKDLCKIIDLANESNKRGTRVSFSIPLTEVY